MGIAERIASSQEALKRLEIERAWAWVGAILALVPFAFSLVLAVANFLPISFPNTLYSILIMVGVSVGTASLFFFGIDKARASSNIEFWYKGLWIGNVTATVMLFLWPPLLAFAVIPILSGGVIARRFGTGSVAVFLLVPIISFGISFAVRMTAPYLLYDGLN